MKDSVPARPADGPGRAHEYSSDAEDIDTPLREALVEDPAYSTNHGVFTRAILDIPDVKTDIRQVDNTRFCHPHWLYHLFWS
jgi:hypothetical protein